MEMSWRVDTSRPLQLETLKGKVDLKWYGHAGFKIHFLDAEGVHRNLYIDIWINNQFCRDEDKMVCPNDCDLALVTHGQIDHSMHAPNLINASKKDKKEIVCTSEVGSFYEQFKRMPPGRMAKMQRGGTKDFGYCKITMVHADHSSSCFGPRGFQVIGGVACGYVINIPHHNISIYHAGDTNMFSDMKLIDDLYRPDIALLPIGDMMGMGPREAAYCVKNFLPTPKLIIPMHFGTFPYFTGTPEEFQRQCSSMGVEGKNIVDPREFLGGKPIVE